MENTSPAVEHVERLASQLLAHNALGALRGPMSRGAVPAKSLAEQLGRPRNTVTRFVSRCLGHDDATPFDLAAQHTLDPEKNGHQHLWGLALDAYRDGFLTATPEGDNADLVRQVVSQMLESSFSYQAASDFRFTLINGYLLHTAALACDRAPLEPGIAVARERIVGMRKQSFEQSAAIYENALRLVLRGSQRRAKRGYSDRDIVVALHSTYDGYILRHLLDPEAYPIRLVVDVLWDLAVAMTEPGFLGRVGDSGSLGEELLAGVLSMVRTKDVVPSLDDVAAAIGIDPKVAKALFPDPDQLAETCLDVALAATTELRELAVGVRGTGLTILADLLRSLGEVADLYRPLVDRVPEAPAWREVSALVAQVLDAAGEEICSVDTTTAANLLVRAAVRGREAETEWQTAIEMLRASPGRPAHNETF
jgi:hypothetical protein